MEQSNWAPEHSDALRELIARGMSFAEAARAINSRFNTSYSRSAALGRARRLGVGPEDRQQPSMPTGPAELRETTEARPVSFRALALPWPTAVFKEAAPVKLRCVAVEPRHLSLIELERGDCRYPYGGDEENEATTFCGHPRQPGSSYCSPHFYLSREPIEPPDRHRFVAIDRDGANSAINCVADGLKRLPRQHRIALLRALIGLQPADDDRWGELSELLCEEILDVSVQ